MKLLFRLLQNQKFLHKCNLRSIMNAGKAKPILYGDEISPPVRFVMMTASILKIELNFHKIDLFKSENRSDFFKKVNPLQKVPALIIGESAVTDSHAISLYLCQIANDCKLYPEEPVLRAKVNQMLFYNSSTLFRVDSEILTNFFARKWPVDEKVEEWLAALDYLENILHENTWLTGSEMRLCDVCLVAVVTSLSYLIPLTERHSNIQKWIKKFEDLPFYHINREGLNNLYSYIDKMNNLLS